MIWDQIIVNQACVFDYLLDSTRLICKRRIKRKLSVQNDLGPCFIDQRYRSSHRSFFWLSCSNSKQFLEILNVKQDHRLRNVFFACCSSNLSSFPAEVKPKFNSSLYCRVFTLLVLLIFLTELKLQSINTFSVLIITIFYKQIWLNYNSNLIEKYYYVEWFCTEIYIPTRQEKYLQKSLIQLTRIQEVR